MEIIKESLKENIKLLALNNLDREPILINEKEKLGEVHDELNKARYKSIRREYGKILELLNSNSFQFFRRTNW
jgi:hypothetical protein